MNQGPPIPPQRTGDRGSSDPVFHALLEVVKETRATISAVSRAEEAIERFEHALIQAQEVCADYDSRLAVLVILAKLGKGLTVRAKRLTAKECVTAITSLKIEMQPDGSGLVFINSTPPIHLPPKLMALFGILAEGAERAPDGLPAWRDRVLLREALEQHVGTGQIAPGKECITAHAFDNLISRLAGILRRHGLAVMQTRRGLGIRLVRIGEPTKPGLNDT